MEKRKLTPSQNIRLLRDLQAIEAMEELEAAEEDSCPFCGEWDCECDSEEEV